MRLQATFLVAMLVSKLSFAGGIVSTAELNPLLAQLPALREFLNSTLHLSKWASAEVRFGPHFVHLSGGTVGPYVIDATTVKDGKPLVVVFCTTARFLDKKGREIPGGRIEQAASVEEKLTGVMLRQKDDVNANSAC